MKAVPISAGAEMGTEIHHMLNDNLADNVSSQFDYRFEEQIDVL